MARKSDDRGGSKGPGPQRDPRDVRIERLERDKAKLIEERDHWKRRSEHLEKELEAARRAGRRQAAPFAKDRPQDAAGFPGGEPGRSTAGRGAAGRRRRLTRPTWRRPRRMSGLRRRGRAGPCGVAVSGRPARGASPRAALRHRGGPLLAVSAARAGLARAADLRRVGRGCRSTGPGRRAGRRVAHRAGHAAGEGPAFCGRSSDCR